MSRPSSRNSFHLEIPRKSVELQDAGAAGLESSDGEDYFSDASEGRKKISRPATPSSPVPRTRVEKVDDVPSHGDEPGTDAYKLRRQDAVPDEVEIVPEGRLSKRNSQNFLVPPASPGGTVVPRTVVEKLDPDTPSYGDVPGTSAYKQRMADATPDVVLKNPDPAHGALYQEKFRHNRTPSGQLIPETIITKVDDEPSHGEVGGTKAKEIRTKDTTPDKVEIKGDLTGLPTMDRSIDTNQESTANDHENNDDDFGDDFDDFEEGAQAGADDDFGDFDNGFQESPDLTTPVSAFPDLAPDVSFPLLSTDALASLQDLTAATQIHMDTMFPSTTSEQLSALPTPEAVPDDGPIFPSERSRSLWNQLITPPPLQPPNWTQSRIRRLFLISLGVPVDLDEILPPSKQKKLILPDINLDSSAKSQSSDKADGSLRRMRSSKFNQSSVSVNSNRSRRSMSRTRTKRSQSKVGAFPPPLDFIAVRRLCTTTEEKLEGFTDEELQTHVQELEDMMQSTQEVLEYWLRRRDGLRKEKEAFEGVIENLVRHARRVRK